MIAPALGALMHAFILLSLASSGAAFASSHEDTLGYSTSDTSSSTTYTAGRGVYIRLTVTAPDQDNVTDVVVAQSDVDPSVGGDHWLISNAECQ